MSVNLYIECTQVLMFDSLFLYLIIIVFVVTGSSALLTCLKDTIPNQYYT